MTELETALIVPIPEAEPAVGALRARLDSSAAWGVPAHITVLYPFLPPEQLTDDALAAVAEVCAATPRFTTKLASVRWFGDAVVWLAPEPDQPFRDLTDALWRRFPQAPPYGGTFDDVVPHLTIGHDAGREALDAAEQAVAPHLPITVDATEVRLLQGASGSQPWVTVRSFALA
ncbi:MAG: 2'-5' RNA ligase family protein [Hamadaea sp.]|uniref:2'-5' RNA ligase family protein n=1 Tax=Hamadaea sp. TaxID=2024425 RepID=UPI0017DDF5B7|nr:2'-5' RNA ligase family protein [Hamadaea sp.]NUT18736.1 2'-5' RNA ligase family protein [Hamadaea sp.]